MTHPRRFAAVAALASSLALGIGLAPLVTAGAAPPPAPQLPQLPAARQAAGWLAGQFNAQGFIPTTPGSDQPNLSATAQGILGLAAADVDQAVAGQAMSYLEANLASYATADGADGPGQLALLILDAEALGTNPRSLDGSDLVARLLATQQSSGADTGLFGTATQLGTYLAGTYTQGLALAALAGAGVHGTAQITGGVAWLAAQQCSDGGWALPDQAINPCTGSPATFSGPDTNSTALAIEGLVAEGAL
ncbi:MAG TPA: hypothetical protein VHW47_10525, partial [Acidimicrobiales bacterium]|nr:hypothetical protein [Acidimicrobiales bacterium]